MFTLDELKNLCQELDDHYTKITNRKIDNNTTGIRTLDRTSLLKIEKAFASMFEKDTSQVNKNHFTFMCNGKRFVIYFCQNMLTINEWIHISSQDNRLVFNQFTPIHEFIFNNCNPEGAFLVEKLLFKEHL